LRFKVEDKPSDIELMEWFEYVCSLPTITNTHEIISSFDESSLVSINMIENSNMDVHTNHDEVVFAMYDKFLHLVHTPYSINDDHDTLLHVKETQSQTLENFDNQLEEDTTNLKI